MVQYNLTLNSVLVRHMNRVTSSVEACCRYGNQKHEYYELFAEELLETSPPLRARNVLKEGVWISGQR